MSRVLIVPFSKRAGGWSMQLPDEALNAGRVAGTAESVSCAESGAIFCHEVGVERLESS
jgi:hypothetical protein